MMNVVPRLFQIMSHSTLCTMSTVHFTLQIAQCTLQNSPCRLSPGYWWGEIIPFQPSPHPSSSPTLFYYVAVKLFGLALPYAAPPPSHPPPWSHHALALQGPATRVALESFGRRSVRSCPEEGAVIVYYPRSRERATAVKETTKCCNSLRMFYLWWESEECMLPW